MNQPLDNFFREKLEHAHKPAPAAAWDRIDAGLQGRQRKGLWLKIAAALLIVAVASYILWPNPQQGDTPHMTAQSTPKAGQPVQKDVPPSNPEQQHASTHAPSAPTVAMTPAVKPQVKKQHTAAPAINNTVRKPDQDQPPVAYEAPQALQINTEPAPVLESIVPVQPAPASANVALAEVNTESETDEAITLVYSADEINEKYLDKEALAKATSAQKKPSTFRKLLEKAYDLKNNQDPMGGLRQRKNEILALSFKSEKRSQNK